MTTQNLSQELLLKLNDNYDKIASLYNGGIGLEEIGDHMGITDTDMWKIEEVMFDMYPVYTSIDMDGNERVFKYNARTLQSKEITDEY